MGSRILLAPLAVADRGAVVDLLVFLAVADRGAVAELWGAGAPSSLIIAPSGAIMDSSILLPALLAGAGRGVVADLVGLLLLLVRFSLICGTNYRLDSQNTKQLKKLKLKMLIFYKQKSWFSQIVSKNQDKMKSSKNNNINLGFSS